LILVFILKGIFVLTCIFLILCVLLQSGKGGDVAAAFGGAGAQSAFGPRGAAKPLEKATVIAAIVFMFLALLFSLPGFNGQNSVVQEGAAATVPTPGPAGSPVASPAASPQASVSPSAAASPAAENQAAGKDAKAAASPNKK
jgi:preprotein translocase subunit SecG